MLSLKINFYLFLFLSLSMSHCQRLLEEAPEEIHDPFSNINVCVNDGDYKIFPVIKRIYA